MCGGGAQSSSPLKSTYWTTKDKLKFTDWTQVNRMFGSGEIAVFPTGDNNPPPLLTTVNIVLVLDELAQVVALQ